MTQPARSTGADASVPPGRWVATAVVAAALVAALIGLVLLARSVAAGGTQPAAVLGGRGVGTDDLGPGAEDGDGVAADAGDVVGSGEDVDDPAEGAAARDGEGGPSAGTPGPAGAASWQAFATEPDGSVVRWDPCAPVRWAFSPERAPIGGRAVVEEAVARVAAATGLVFEDLGDVDERPRADRPATVADATAWAPVVVGWVDDTETDLPLRRQDRGVALTGAADGGQGRVLVTGQVALNTAWPLEPRFVERHTDWGPVVLHELGHVVGLDHVDDPAQLMHRSPGFGPVDWGAGDLAGLDAVGAAGGCRPGPPPADVDVPPPAVVSD